jgi:hypothetical protein
LDRRALNQKDVDLAGIEIDQPKPWTAATLSLGWSHGTDVRREMVLPGASAISAGAGCSGLSPARFGGRLRSGSEAGISSVSVKPGRLQRCHSSKASLVSA